jgi:hypothetical protein
MVISLSEALKRRFPDYVTEVQDVFTILGISQLIDQELDGVWRRSDEAQAAQMSHLFSRLVVEPVSEVDFMVEEG